MLGSRHFGESREIKFDSGNGNQVSDYEGFSDSGEGLRAPLSAGRIHILQDSICGCLEESSRLIVISFPVCFRITEDKVTSLVSVVQVKLLSQVGF